MRARANTIAIKPAARANRPDMRARMDAAIANTGAGGHDRAGMSAGRHAMLVHACARADAADMGARAHAMLADMRANADAQDINIQAHGRGRDGGEQCEREKRSRENFHGRHPG